MPGAIFITSEGKKKYVNEQEFASELRAGSVPQTNLDIVDPASGKPISLSPGEAAEFFQAAGPAAAVDPDFAQQEYDRNRAEETYGGLGNKALAGVAGLARGASLGLSDVALRAIGVDAEDIQGVREAHRGTSLATEIGGAIAPALLSGGSTAPASAARLAPAALAFRAGQAVSKGATTAKGLVKAGVVEGALHGAGQGISNLAIRDEQLSVESVVSEIGLNTLLGGGFGGAGGAAGWALGKAGSKLVARAEQKALAADAATLTRETVGSLSDASKLAFNELDEVAPKLFGKADDFLRGSVDELDDVALQNTVNHLDSLGAQSKAAAINLGKHTPKIKAVEKAQKAMAAADGPEEMLEALGKYQNAIDDLRGAMGRPPTDKINVMNKVALEAPEGLEEALKVARTAYDDFTKAGLAKNPLDAILAAESVEEMVEQAGKLDALGKSMSNLDELMGTKMYSTRFNDALAELSGKSQNLMGETASGMDLVGLAAVFGIEEALLPDFGGPIDDILKLALAVKFAGAAGKATSKAAGFAKQTLGSAARAAVRGRVYRGQGSPAQKAVVAELGAIGVSKMINAALSGTGRIQAATARASVRLQKAFGKLSGKVGKGLTKSAPVVTGLTLRNTNYSNDEVPRNESELDAFKRIQGQISNLAANQKATAERVHNNVAPVRLGHFGVGDKTAGHLLNVVEYLNAKMPRDPGRLQYFGRSKWRPSEFELDKFARTLAAVNDPVSAVERLADGKMTREDADALRNVHPAMFAQIQNFLLDNIEEVQNFDYEHRIQISQLMGIQADPIASRFSVWQQTFQNDAMLQQQQSASAAQPTSPTMGQQTSAPRQ